MIFGYLRIPERGQRRWNDFRFAFDYTMSGLDARKHDDDTHTAILSFYNRVVSTTANTPFNVPTTETVMIRASKTESLSGTRLLVFTRFCQWRGSFGSLVAAYWSRQRQPRCFVLEYNRHRTYNAIHVWRCPILSPIPLRFRFSTVTATTQWNLSFTSFTFPERFERYYLRFACDHKPGYFINSALGKFESAQISISLFIYLTRV